MYDVCLWVVTILKRIATQTETHNLLPLEWFVVRYQPSVRNIKDKKVKENTKTVRIAFGVHLDNLDGVLKDLKKNRLRFIEVIPDIMKLPLRCPVCGKVGSPTINDDKRAKLSDFDYQGNRIKQYEKYLKYNHPKGKGCRIGKYKILKTNHIDGKRTNKQIPCLILKKGLTREDLGYRGRTMINSL